MSSTAPSMKADGAVPASALGVVPNNSSSPAGAPKGTKVGAAYNSAQVDFNRPAGAAAGETGAGGRDFTSGVGDCAESWPICLDAWCCGYCVASAQHNRVVNEQEGISWPTCGGLYCADVLIGSLTSYLCDLILPQALCVHTCYMRQTIRRRYHLAGETESLNAKDVALVCCCLPCVIAQHQRELAYHDEWPGGVLSNRNSIAVPTTVETL